MTTGKTIALTRQNFVVFISHKIDFKTKAVERDKKGHYIMIKGSIQEEYITIINIYALVYCIDQPWDLFGRNDAKTETPVLWPPHAKS